MVYPSITKIRSLGAYVVCTYLTTSHYVVRVFSFWIVRDRLVLSTILEFKVAKACFFVKNVKLLHGRYLANPIDVTHKL